MQNEQQQHPAAPVRLGGTEAVREARRSFLDRFRQLSPCRKPRLFPHVFHSRRCHKPIHDHVTLTSDRNGRPDMPESRESVRLSEQCSIIQHRDIACLRNKKIDRNRIELTAPLEIPIEKTKNKVRSELAQTDLEEKFVQHATLSFRQHPDPLTVRLDLIQLAHEWGIFVYRAAMLTDQAAHAARSEKPKRPPVSPAKVTMGRNRPEKIKYKDNYRGRFFTLLALMILTEIFILTYLMR